MSTFTPEQIAELATIINGHRTPPDSDKLIELDQKRIDLDKMRIRADVLRMSKEALIENRNSMPAESRAISANDVTAFATAFMNFADPQ